MRVRLPQRAYLFYAGPIETALRRLPATTRSVSRVVSPRLPSDEAPADVPLDSSPNLWWPDDRAWFVATEVDHAWTYVAGSQQLLNRLMAEPRLEILPAETSDNPFVDGDLLNAALDQP
jgi:hypothetical protein